MYEDLASQNRHYIHMHSERVWIYGTERTSTSNKEKLCERKIVYFIARSCVECSRAQLLNLNL